MMLAHILFPEGKKMQRCFFSHGHLNKAIQFFGIHIWTHEIVILHALWMKNINLLRTVKCEFNA